MFKLGGLAKGSGKLVVLNYSLFMAVFKVGGLAKGSGELVFLDHSKFV
jgi:hypothetical protein